eukprot:CAMPEP_0197399290 /NCGR_PEP_ID=MMETSP1165-20131217/14922_1 /TAXON_ID=284809 /ORGANISM="Chrysocystis fragilis, Strain CCMP3189" /LENGTH=31 /DNA_ID= /DNA_START= /DNA_END= /DNA_ORIENTATION=
MIGSWDVGPPPTHLAPNVLTQAPSSSPGPSA